MANAGAARAKCSRGSEAPRPGAPTVSLTLGGRWARLQEQPSPLRLKDCSFVCSQTAAFLVTPTVQMETLTHRSHQALLRKGLSLPLRTPLARAPIRSHFLVSEGGTQSLNSVPNGMRVLAPQGHQLPEVTFQSQSLTAPANLQEHPETPGCPLSGTCPHSQHLPSWVAA